MKAHQQEPRISASQIHSTEFEQKEFQPQSIAAAPHCNGAKEEPLIVSDSDHQVTINNRYSKFKFRKIKLDTILVLFVLVCDFLLFKFN